MPATPTIGKRRLAALFTIEDIDDNLRELLAEKDGYHLHKAMINYWLELRFQRINEHTTEANNGS